MCWNHNRIESFNRAVLLDSFGSLHHGATMRLERVLQRLAQVAQQVPAISDLNGFWASSSCRFGFGMLLNHVASVPASRSGSKSTTLPASRSQRNRPVSVSLLPCPII